MDLETDDIINRTAMWKIAESCAEFYVGSTACVRVGASGSRFFSVGAGCDWVV